MGFLRRLFGAANRTSDQPVHKAAALLFESKDDGPVVYGVDVVGESYYQPALDEIAEGRTTDGCVNREHLAALVPEPQNPYDKQAIAVHIEGRLVGHLSREDAQKYGPVLRRCRDADRYAAVRATLTGGWDRGDGDRGDIGVKLALGKPSEMLSALAAEEGLPDHGGPGPDEGDPLFRAAIAVVQEYDRASASLLQRRLKIGYAQTARIIDQLEARGYVGSFDGSNARRVLRHEDSASRER